MQYGHFDDARREYVITDPRTPRPWHNYLANDEYLVNITQHGTGASFYQPAGEGLRTNLTEDRDGSGGPRFVYLRDRDSAEYWTVTGAPMYHSMDEWECRIGLGYQINRGLCRGIEASWRVFVPRGSDSCELWTIEIANRSERERRIGVFPFVEMNLTGGSTLMDFIAVLGGRFEPADRAVYGINSCVKFPPKFKGVLASDREVAAATVSRDEFLGHYRGYRNPVAVERGDVHNPEAGTEWLGASLRHDLALAPGESVRINCLVGVIDSVEDGRRLIETYLAPGVVEERFGEIQAHAAELCGRTVVHTGNEQFDRWMNVWLKHQLAFVAGWGRVIGRGFRDILQDTMGHRLTDPGRARACIKEVFAKQFPTGKCIRAWRLPTAQLDLQDYADSPSWMVMALCSYLKETADYGLLDEMVPYLDGDDPYAEPTEEASVWDHVVLAQRYLVRQLGRHGLCKIYYGDWCDTMNGVGARGEGESVMLSMQVKWGCDLLAELAERLGREHVAGEMRIASAMLAGAVNQEAWDGEWYVRAFDDDGLAVGSRNTQPGDNGEGEIFLNPQSWALISGVVPAQRAGKCVASVAARLDTGYGMVLNAPPFTALRPRIGQMTAMTPGFYENGSVYVHGNCFWIYALACAGRGDEAWKAFRAILPDTDNKPNTDTEPFTIPNYYIGPAVERRKQRNLYLSGWRTGSAAWLYMTGLEWICGVRADYDGLRIDPHLPAGWRSCRVERWFRGDTYEVIIEGGGEPDARVKEVRVDGARIEGNLVPPAGDGRRHEVRVIVG